MSWLKFDCATPEKPEVFAITQALGFDDPDLTVGKLLKVWRWFDVHSVDGTTKNLSASLLDRLVGCNGLSQAMVDVGWLIVIDGSLCLSNFDIHNGSTAKGRALGAKRSALHRSNDASVTESLPRGVERREEKKTKTGKKQQTASRLPNDFVFDADFAKQSGVVDLQSEIDKFKDYYNSLDNRHAFRADWSGVWRNWCRKAGKPLTLRLVDKPLTVPSESGDCEALIKARKDAQIKSKPDEKVKQKINALLGRKTA